MGRLRSSSRRAPESEPLDLEMPAEDVDGDALRAGVELVIGTDEAGRGPLAGPVMAAAVGIRACDLAWASIGCDSKAIDEGRRAEIEAVIVRESTLWEVAHGTEEEIARDNILATSLATMRRVVTSVASRSGVASDRILVLVDGNRTIPGLMLRQRALVGGDARSRVIGCASILAKASRDRWMDGLALEWPGYGFERHRGYGTPEHLERLRALGPCPAHRRRFGPVRALLESRGEARPEEFSEGRRKKGTRE